MNFLRKNKPVLLLFTLLLFIAGLPMLVSANPVINKESLTIEQKASYKLKITGGATDVTWQSDKPDVVKVNSKTGKVTGKLRGSATVTATYKYNNWTYTSKCLVSVVKKGSSTEKRYIVLMLDTSGSMSGTPSVKQKEAAKEFCKTILKADGDNYISLVHFASGANIISPFTSSKSDLYTAIDGAGAYGGTNVKDALVCAKNLLGGITASKVSKYVVICSDGQPTSSLTETYAVDDELKAKGYFIYALGFFHSLYGTTLQRAEEVMERLASKDGYKLVQKLDDLKPVLKKIAKKVVTKKYKVTFNANGGKASKSSKKVTKGKTYGTLPTATRSGYKFLGWYTKKSGGTKITADTKVTLTKKQTLYAHWQANEKVKKTVVVTNATDGKPIKKAKVKFRLGYDKKSGTVVAQSKTNSKGKFTINIPKGEYTAEVSKSGFVKTYFNIDCKKSDRETVSVSPKTLAATQYRVVLTWGKTPADLDALLTGPLSDGDRFLVYWKNKVVYDNNAKVAELDIDQRESYGPETVTVDFKVASSGTFHFYVRDYTNSTEGGTDQKALGKSKAQVILYSGNKQIASYSVPKKSGTLWHVFSITNGTLKKVNKMSNSDEIE